MTDALNSRVLALQFASDENARLQANPEQVVQRAEEYRKFLEGEGGDGEDQGSGDTAD